MSVTCLNDAEKSKIVYLSASDNWTNAKLASEFKVSVRTIQRVLKEHRDKNKQVPAVAKKVKKAKKAKKIKGAIAPVTMPAPVVNFTAPKQYQWVGNKKQISVFTEDDVYTIAATNPNFAKVLLMLQRGEYEAAVETICLKKAVIAFTKGKVTIENSVLKYNDIIIDNSLTRRIVDAINNGESSDSLLNFFENLMLNPSRDAVYQLFDFLTHNDIEITEDGYFIGWKRVAHNYKDFYTGKWDNTPGKVLEMERACVDDDPNQTCSHGFHVAAASYIPHYHGGDGLIVACKVHPRDVVSIPTDYNNAKMRVCKYKVIADVTNNFQIAGFYAKR